MEIKCQITGKEFRSLRGFCNHLRTLKMSSKQYYDTYIKKPEEGVCICGNLTSWKRWGYSNWCNSQCSDLVIKRTKSVKYRYCGEEGENKKIKAMNKRGIVDNNVSKRKTTISKKCQNLGITLNEYYSLHSKQAALSMTKEQKDARILKRMCTCLDTGRTGGKSYYKKYELFGTEIIVQGYEPQILDYLQKTVMCNDIKVANGKKINPIKYNSISGIRSYFPDMELKDFIIEVKSKYTFDKNKDNVYEKIGGVFDSKRNIILTIPLITEIRKNKLDGSKKLLDWAISIQASNDDLPQEPFVVIYDEGSTTILLGVESNDSKCRGSDRILSEHDIVWSPINVGVVSS